MSKNGVVTMEPVSRTTYAKHERYDWEVPGDRGAFEWIPKHLLKVDHRYQRQGVSKSRVLEIARNWSWPALGTIGVFHREDNTRWVYDGQHRWLAALKRDDVQELPCRVFAVRGADFLRIEAKGFDDANNVRGSMRRLEKHKARVVAQDKWALEIEALVESCGYRISEGKAFGTVTCVDALEQAIKQDHEATETAFLACKEAAAGDSFHHKLFKAMFYLEQHLKKSGLSIESAHIREKLQSLDHNHLLRVCEDAERYHGKNGARVGADGLVRFINKGKRTRQIPGIF